jgi:hypothetical protein
VAGQVTAFNFSLSLITTGANGTNSSLPVTRGDLTHLASDNTISGRYNVTRAGSYQLRVSYQGTALAGSPYRVMVSPARAFAARCTAKVDRFPARNASSSFWVTSQDSWGNKLRVGGDHYFVKIVGPEVGHP